jgi:hypothetical protein
MSKILLTVADAKNSNLTLIHGLRHTNVLSRRGARIDSNNDATFVIWSSRLIDETQRSGTLAELQILGISAEMTLHEVVRLKV